MEQLQRVNQTKVVTPLAVVRIQKNSRPSIQWPEGGLIPEAFQRVTVTLDGAKAYDAFKAGTLPKGFEVEHGSHLRIQ